MTKINKQIFFDRYKQKFGSLKQEQVDNINILIDTYDNDNSMERLSWLAYIFATIYHECAATWHPIREYGCGKGRPYGIADSQTGQKYYGRGWVQLTWKYNYEKAAKELGIDCVNNPDLVMEVENATKICFLGMKDGWFTRKKLSDYFTDNKTDWISARKIINGMDKANLIAGYAKKFYDCLEYEDIQDNEPINNETIPDTQLAQVEDKEHQEYLKSVGIEVRDALT